MAFTPVRMKAPDGSVHLVGSATEREQLLTRGYAVVEPERAPNPSPIRRAVERDTDAKKTK
ncbi:hypothetical protein [Nocardia wallacei]|uniref:hypothetical protein n=1 Tax=Nocardia wallacei TaxID=480035 RepID=UPI0024566945|nr:hypothetical protein [Nocardia wallacei]